MRGSDGFPPSSPVPVSEQPLAGRERPPYATPPVGQTVLPFSFLTVVIRTAPVAGFRSHATSTPKASRILAGVSTAPGGPSALTLPPASSTIRFPYSARSDRS